MIRNLVVIASLFYLYISAAFAYEYTSLSDNYFSSSEYDEIIRNVLKEISDEAGLPKGYADLRYSLYKEKILEISKKDVIQAFKWVESTGNSVKNAEKGSKIYEKQKLIYIHQFKKAVKKAIRSNRIMNAIVGFNYSDRIMLFKSTVTVHNSGKLNIIEEITIYNGDGQGRGNNYQANLNDEIKRGIRREFPTKYVDNKGFLKIVPFNIISVKRNGNDENYFEETATNGVVLYIGSEDYYLPNGIYTYRIEYETAEQMVFLKNYDEVYWNVTGNGWSFSIDSVICSIVFPGNSKIIQQDCYTGYFGADEKACGYNIINDSTISFHSTIGLEPYQGLTVAAAIPKGIVELQSDFANFIDFLLDNFTIPFIAIIFLLVFIINYIVWHRVGRDPKKGTIYPQFEPPPGLSPSEVGYIIEQNYQPKLAAAALIDAAVNRHISIDVKNEGLIFKQNVYYINKSETTKPVKTDYHSFGDSHYIDNIDKIKKGDYNSSLYAFSKEVESFVEEEHLVDRRKKKGKSGVFAKNSNVKSFGVILLILSVFLIFFYMAIFENYAPATLAITAGIFVMTLIVQFVFSKIMGAYTHEGRKLADKILGFKMYLEATEQRIFDKLNPPDMTLQLFEKYLPFAVALGVENRWAAKFEDKIIQAVEAGTYNPVWYRGSITDLSRSSNFTSTMTSGFAGSISSASTPPSSSSGGSSGGGSSGGGGGGGGGGGW